MNRSKSGIIILLLILQCAQSNAQQLKLSGKITFERKENIHKLLSEQEGNWAESMLQHTPKYRTDRFQLSFNLHKTFYQLLNEDEVNFFNWFKVAANNSVVNNFDNKQYVAEKTIYERTYRIEDSIPQLQWKLLGEYREVAGYNCRKASTIIMDSLYIIAFYTDEIPVSGGPESFSGLPGMILGIVVPRLNITYFATKVETQLIPETEFVIKTTKSKKTNFIAYKDELNKAVKDWGKYASKVMWKAIL